MKAWIGLMSGTSMDGIDAVLVSFPDKRIEIHATHTLDYPHEIRQRLYQLSQNHGTPDELGELDRITGRLFARAAAAVLETSGKEPADIAAIGSHGQTIRHQPGGSTPFSIQVGDPSLIAEYTGITTVADFRRRDMAAGGEGAPLVPAFHRAFFSSEKQDRCILNLGGIANISWLPASPDQPDAGFDTGPANALLDAWCLDQTGRPFDEDGRWAAEGTVNARLLDDMLSDAYFARPAPKSTGKEKFNIDWIRTLLSRHPQLPPADVQRTLLALTVQSIRQQLPAFSDLKLYVCGGGTHNPLLMAELEKACQPSPVSLTTELGLPPQWVEPTAFAWLAKQTLEKKTGNVPEVTGARAKRILGGVYFA